METLMSAREFLRMKEIAMGFRFKRSMKIAPGVRLNFGKKSSSISLGTRGARYTINSNGKRTKSVGIPGTNTVQWYCCLCRSRIFVGNTAAN